uniref:Glutamate decarboxylase n=2 Tax=Clytia hemisphaerica TaxID=252671 RepID=A0A7M5XDJ4_9CNID
MEAQNYSFVDLLPYSSKSEVTHEFLNKIAQKASQYLEECNNRENKVIEFTPPAELIKLVDFQINENGDSLNDILRHTDQILKYVVKTAHPRFFNPLWAGVDTMAVAGEWLTSATNTSMYTYEIAPVFLIMEKFIWELINQKVGFKDGDGMFFPGGSLCNIAAINLARFKCCPNIKEDGVFGMKKLIIYTSEESHYSITKGAALCGIGTKNVVKIRTNDVTGKMIAEDLDEKIQQSIAKGEQPMMVVATAGTTVGGAYDPINQIADVTDKYNIWLHVDGAWGGPVLLSEKYKKFMDGCHRIDSLTWDPHKMMGLLQQCSFLVVKEKGLLQQCNSANASYLFQKDKQSYDVSWDSGDKTFVCGRRNDILKLWMYFKAKGLKGVENDINKCFENSRYLTSKIKERENFSLLREPECTNVCFRYTPPRIARMPEGAEREKELTKVAPEIKKKMTEKGSMMVAYQPLKEHVNFFRMINSNPGQTFSDMDFILDEIERLGKDL